MDTDSPLFSHLMAYVDDADRDVADTVSGNPDWEPPTALRAGLREYAGGPSPEFQHPPSEGLEPLREEIAECRGVDAERIVITNGGGGANYLAMACGLERCSGDGVVVADPIHPYYSGRTAMLDGDLRPVPVAADGMLNPAAVRERVLRDGAILGIPRHPRERRAADRRGRCRRHAGRRLRRRAPGVDPVRARDAPRRGGGRGAVRVLLARPDRPDGVALTARSTTGVSGLAVAARAG
jgi:hypothetical protein